MEILKNREIYDCIVEESGKCREKVLFLTAFCKLDALIEIDTYLDRQIASKILVVRFGYADIKTGASDLEIYEYCKFHNWQLYFQLDLHVKTYIFDDKSCISGSANLTKSGLGTSEKHNDELSIGYEIEQVDLKKIKSFLDDAVLIDDEIYEMMKHDINDSLVGEAINEDWNKQIKSMFHRKVGKIFMEELPHNGYVENACGNDYSFMKLAGEIESIDIAMCFQESRAFRWLIGKLEETENKEMYFGTLTACLHEDIITEPKPYRREVKELLKNLIEWSQTLAGDRIKVDVPKHSTRIRLM